LLGVFFGGATKTNYTSEGNLPLDDVCGFFMSLLSEKAREMWTKQRKFGYKLHFLRASLPTAGHASCKTGLTLVNI